MKFNTKISNYRLLAKEICKNIADFMSAKANWEDYHHEHPWDDTNPYTPALHNAENVQIAPEGDYGYFQLSNIKPGNTLGEYVGWITFGNQTNYHQEYLFGERTNHFIVVDTILNTIKVFNK